MRTLVVLSGGFHPFHAGHMSLYNAAKAAFPGADVVVGATNVTKDRPFPFKIKQKLAQVAGVPPANFVEVDRQFSVQPANIAKRIKDPENTVVIFVRSDKDRNTQPMPARVDPKTGQLPTKKDGTPVSNYLLDYAGNEHNLEPVTQHAYMAYLPTVQFAGGLTSASEIRNNWPKLKPNQKLALVNSMYPRTKGNAKLSQTVVGMLDAAIGSTAALAKPAVAPIDKIKANPLKEHIRGLITELRPLIKEASLEQKQRFAALLEGFNDPTNPVPYAVELFHLMTPSTRNEMIKYLDMIRQKYGRQFSLKVYKQAQDFYKKSKDVAPFDV